VKRWAMCVVVFVVVVAVAVAGQPDHMTAVLTAFGLLK
jgi:hypothetical protein